MQKVGGGLNLVQGSRIRQGRRLERVAQAGHSTSRGKEAGWCTVGSGCREEASVGGAAVVCRGLQKADLAGSSGRRRPAGASSNTFGAEQVGVRSRCEGRAESTCPMAVAEREPQELVRPVLPEESGRLCGQ